MNEVQNAGNPYELPSILTNVQWKFSRKKSGLYTPPLLSADRLGNFVHQLVGIFVH